MLVNKYDVSCKIIPDVEIETWLQIFSQSCVLSPMSRNGPSRGRDYWQALRITEYYNVTSQLLFMF